MVKAVTLFFALVLICVLPATDLKAATKGCHDKVLQILNSSNVDKINELELSIDLYNKTLKSLIESKLTFSDIKKELKKLSGTKEFNEKLNILTTKLSEENPAEEVFAELFFELKIIKMIHDNYDQLGDLALHNPIISVRSTSSNNMEWNLGVIEERVDQYLSMSGKELHVIGFKIRDLFTQNFMNQARRVDGITIPTRAAIVKWLKSPKLSKIKTAKEIRVLIKSIGGLEAKWDEKWGWRTCTVYNPLGLDALAEKGLFVVQEILPGRNAMQTQHTFLNFIPADLKSDPIIIDFTFNQFDTVFDDGLFVGTEKELEKILNKDKKQLKFFYTSDVDRYPHHQGVTKEVILKIKKNLGL